MTEPEGTVETNNPFSGDRSGATGVDNNVEKAFNPTVTGRRLSSWVTALERYLEGRIRVIRLSDCAREKRRGNIVVCIWSRSDSWNNMYPVESQSTLISRGFIFLTTRPGTASGWCLFPGHYRTLFRTFHVFDSFGFWAARRGLQV